MQSDSNERRVFLGMPGYGKQTAAAGRAFWRARADMSSVCAVYQQGSLLACNFNALWCSALNLVHDGQRVDYFAMLHDDIGAEDFWLDKLIDELEATNLDVLGVAVPIKDSRGLTSTALHKDGDNWMPECRVSMHDLFQLPETFTSNDLDGKAILLNTGCWVCRFDPAWVKQVHFTINDRIVFNRAAGENGRYQAQTEPEDWYFSRLLHELELKVGCTRKVHVAHQGEMIFTNERPWGSEAFDKEYTTRSPVPNAFPVDVAGWLTSTEGKALSQLAEGKRVLEIGSYCGLSTICLARTAEHVTAMDYFDGRATAVPQETLPQFLENMERHGVREKVVTCHPDEPTPLAEYDVVFIDGAHDYDSVKADIAKGMDVLAADGLLAFHDYHSPIDPGVTMAVDEFLATGAALLSLTGSVAVVRPACTLSEV